MQEENLIKINKGELYILSGIPASGKSTWIKENNLSNFVVSMDEIRKKIGGSWTILNDEGETQTQIHGEDINANVAEIAKIEVLTKLNNGITCIIDAVNPSDKERKTWAKIAEDLNIPITVIIFNTPAEECKKRNTNKDRAFVPTKVIDKFAEKMVYESKYPYEIITPETKVKTIIDYPEQNKIPSNIIIDAIGDIHGQYDDMIELIKKAGYSIDNGIVNHTDSKRRLLFLGDIIDRGEDNLKVINFIYSLVKQGHYMIKGNHENKISKMLVDDKGINGSFANMKTIVELKQLPEKEIMRLKIFFDNLPLYYIQEKNHEKFIFVHANITHFDQFTTNAEILYGPENHRKKEDEKIDSDLMLHKNLKLIQNNLKTFVVRGHIIETSKTPSVVVLEEGAGFKEGAGLLCYQTDSKKIIKQEVKKLFNLEMPDYILKLQDLQKNKMVTNKLSADGLFVIWKYSKTIFFNNLWHKDPMLFKARGFVTDVVGNIVQHPFDKIFNFKENDTGINIPDNKEVECILKENGFLGCITKHPFKNELLVTTSGSFESEFVGFINELLNKDMKRKFLTLKYLNNNNYSLMFEVIHAQDPHIIDYNGYEGLILIGARGKQFEDKILPESKLDEIAQELGFARPIRFVKKFGEVKKELLTVKHEGFMIREKDTGDYLMKIKSPFYLSTKFLARMGW